MATGGAFAKAPLQAAAQSHPLSAGQILEVNEPQVEHLQLTLAEAFFLSWSLGCLRVLDPNTDTFLTVPELLRRALASHSPCAPPSFLSRPDHPFLVNYVAYHHYRSLGWVVKGGIKFCVDYLLYKKGPVFHHAEFAVVICPIYEDPNDEKASPFDLPNSKPMDWVWLSTINRVNSQAKKALLLAYVTIPAIQQHVPVGPACLSLYSVREIIVRRFIPARMRG